MTWKLFKCSRCERLEQELKREIGYNDILHRIATRNLESDNKVYEAFNNVIERQKQEIEKLEIQITLMGGREL